MRSRAAAVLLLALSGVEGLAACSEKPEPTAIQRGAVLFEPCARKLASTIAADLKKSDAAGFDRYLKEIGGKDEADLVAKVARETLLNYAEALSVSSSMEAELKAGRFDDPLAERKVKAALDKFAQPKMSPPHLCKVLIDGRNAGQWRSGLDLEFAARVLSGEAASTSK